MNALNINDILGKISELRAVFVLGQRAVPFLEEVFFFLKEISPLLDEINASMQDSTFKMPRATSQLVSVSQATELATTEILDLIDAVLARMAGTRSRIEQNAAGLEAIARADARLIRLLRRALKGKDEALLAQVEQVHDEKRTLRRNLSANTQAMLQTLDEMRDKVNRIMISLQVQDITTQQIASVNHLIESVRERMADLVSRLNRGDMERVLDPVLPDTPGTFDPDARYDRSEARQQTADAIVAAFGASEPDDAPSQDEIDQLFATPSTAASQDEIDELFRNGFYCPEHNELK